MVNPPELNAVEAPSEAPITCHGDVFTFKLNQAPYDNGGLFLVIEASEGQSNGVSRAHAKAAAIKYVEEPDDAVIDIRSEYLAKNGALNAAAPKVFFRYYFVDSASGVKSQAMLAQVKWAADASEEQGQQQGGSSTGNGSQSGGSQGGGTQQGGGSGTVTAPAISSEENDNEIYVTITGPAGAEIHYTKNGSEPSAESQLYSSSFTASVGAVIKAIAILGGVSSAVTSYTVPAGGDEPGADDH